MKLEDQVCSLELAKKLKELRVKQKSIFYWHKRFLGDSFYLIKWIDYNHYDMDSKIFKDHFPDHYSAFTVAELGEMLPENIHIFMLKVGKEEIPIWFCEAGECNGEATNWEETNDKNQANAIAKMLIHLIENNLIEVPGK